MNQDQYSSKSYRTQYPTANIDTSMGHLCLRYASDDCISESVALNDSHATITYRELHDAAVSFAYTLKIKGIKLGDRVSILMNQSISAIIAILGVLRAGAAYVPIDPTWPQSRVESILEESGAKLVITTDKIREKHQLQKQWLDFEQFRPFYLPKELVQSLPCPHSNNEAYILFTSGSTGKPNGVRIPHRAVASFFQAVTPLVKEDITSRCLNTSPLHFDVSIIDIFFPLSCGATVYLGPTIPYPSVILNLIEREKITHMCSVGSTLNLLVADPIFQQRDLSTLKRIMTGAEVLNVETIRKLLRVIPELAVINGYGPTEATCACIAYLITNIPDDFVGKLPIGQPLPGIDVQIIAQDEQEGSATDDRVTWGKVGTIAIAGDQVMLGYINRPDLMAERIKVINSRRYYLTGDLGYRDEHGLYHFVGREDEEMKIRGYRIHLSEIVVAFHACPHVVDAVPEIVRYVNGQAIAVAFTIKDINPTTDHLFQVQQSLKNLLPSYMLPRYLGLYTSFPTLPSGKLDIPKIRATLKTQVQRRPDQFVFQLP